MKLKYKILIVSLTLLTTCSLANPLRADDEPIETAHPYLGVRLDPNPLDPLLQKHLRLDENQGILILNVQLDSPAHKADLDRDDIIISFAGNPIYSYQEFIDDIGQTPVDKEVSLQIIHLGQRQTIPVKLQQKRQGKWKYPFEASPAQPFRPGRIFRIDPGEKHWRQVPFGDMPEMRDYFRRFFRQKHFYRNQNDSQNYEITIEGDPVRDDVRIIVRDLENNTNYETTAKDIEDLPEKYRIAAKDALSQAQQSSNLEDLWPKRDYKLHPRADDFSNDLQEKMRDIHKRMELMEKRHEEMIKRLKELDK